MLGLSIRIIFSIGILTYLTSRTNLEMLQSYLSNSKATYFAASVIIFSIGQIVSSIRIKYILSEYSHHVNIEYSLRVHFIGLWFNQVFPTSVGGDLIKIGIVRKLCGYSKALRSVIIERVIGLIFILLQIILCSYWYYQNFVDKKLAILVTISSAIGLLSLYILYALPIGRGFAKMLPRMSRKTILSLLWVPKDLKKFFKLYTLAKQSWTSLVVHFCGVFAFALICAGLNISATVLDYILVVPIIFLVTMIPISLAGWGIREGASVFMFSLININTPSILIASILFGILFIIVSIPGAIMWSTTKKYRKSK